MVLFECIFFALSFTLSYLIAEISAASIFFTLAELSSQPFLKETSSLTAPTSVAITARPDAIPSNITLGIPSEWLGQTRTSAWQIIFCNSALSVTVSQYLIFDDLILLF